MNLQVDSSVVRMIGDSQNFLGMLGARVRAARGNAGLTRKALSIRCGVSERHLAQVETGKGNISIRLLRQIAEAIEIPLESLVRKDDYEDETLAILQRIEKLDRIDKVELLSFIEQWAANRGSRDKQKRVALIGLRGAGKSTIGRLAGEKLGLPFLELDDEIERVSGLAIAEIFSLYGEQRYRELERECLNGVIESNTEFVIAVAGGIVSNMDTYSLLLRNCHTVWLTAQPEEHMGRVMAQGDRRAVDGNPDAMKNLKSLLESRTPLYRRAHYRIDTSGKKPAECCEEIVDLLDSV